MERAQRGLSGMIAGETAISSIDGERGELRYRGYRIEDLARRASFVEAAGLVLDGELPDADARHGLEGALAARELPDAACALLRALPATTHPMALLQAALPLLGPPSERDVPRAKARARQRATLLGLCAKLPTLVASFLATRSGRDLPEPDTGLSLHADFLRMLRGTKADPRDVALLDLVQVLQIEHGFNASTFAARVVASTLAPASAVLSSGVGALAGPLHGGADEAAWRMALEIGEPARAAAWVDAALARGERIMGLGHREYRVVDPRAMVLREQAESLAERLPDPRPLRVLAAVEDHAEKVFASRGLRMRANVEFWKGAVFAALGIPPDAFTALFVMARSFGWSAHALEVWDDPVLIRPQAEYVGAGMRQLLSERGGSWR